MSEPMGIFRIDLEIENPLHAGRRQLVPGALVDTGAESSWVPSPILESLGIERRKTMRFRQANGEILERWVGPASFYVAGIWTIDEVVFAEPTDLTALLEGLAEEIRQRHGLPEDAIRIDRRQPLPALGDATELGLVFRNLLENAVKYSEPPVEVRVHLEDADSRVRAEISDRGIGIEPRELRKIFQRFYRAGRDVQRTAVGLGLGLFIVRNLVRRQGGRVVARSEGYGAGSRFVVTLRTPEHA